LVKPVEPALLQVRERLPQEVFLRPSRLLLAERSPAWRSAGLRPGNAQFVENVEAPARGHAQSARGNAVRCVPLHLRTALHAKGLTTPRIQQSQVVVDFRGRGYRRARIPRRVLLPDGHRWRDARDFIDLRLLHAFEELPCVGRKRLDIAALSLRID